MTIDESLRVICTAIQPFCDRDLPNPRGVDTLMCEVYKTFTEEPAIMNMYVAALQAIAAEARKGWRPE